MLLHLAYGITSWASSGISSTEYSEKRQNLSWKHDTIRSPDAPSSFSWSYVVQGIYSSHFSPSDWFLDVIVCLHADKASPTIGLRNFVMPLRASSFHRHELPTIIFVTDLDYIKNEWDMICTFPDIYILNVRIIWNRSSTSDPSLGFAEQPIQSSIDLHSRLSSMRHYLHFGSRKSRYLPRG